MLNSFNRFGELRILWEGHSRYRAVSRCDRETLRLDNPISLSTQCETLRAAEGESVALAERKRGQRGIPSRTSHYLRISHFTWWTLDDLKLTSSRRLCAISAGPRDLEFAFSLWIFWQSRRSWQFVTPQPPPPPPSHSSPPQLSSSPTTCAPPSLPTQPTRIAGPDPRSQTGIARPENSTSVALALRPFATRRF